MNTENVNERIEEQQEFRDHLSSVDSSGKRVWIYPKKPKGRFYDYRTWVSWFLLAVLIILPLIKVNGKPFILLNILERKFILFGIYFPPQDFHLFVLAMLILVIFIAVFTVIYGRLFCGWVCPQTIFMEMVFRKVEYLIEGDGNAQKKLAKAPWDGQKVFKKISKHVIFFIIAVFVSNLFLSYIIGVDEVIKIATEPVSLHFSGFIAMIAFSFTFYGVFAYLRDHVCTTICPYGRLQGVLLDKNSVVITYDYKRGEPRGKIRKPKKGQTIHDLPLLGDCIDCKLCVQVCPTGIDIRNGTQLECVNCTACIDACDEVMQKVKRPLGLIRYDSEEGVRTGHRKFFTPRSIAYTCALGILIVLEVVLFATRTQVETLLLRTKGMLYQKVDDEHYSNLYNYQIINKTSDTMSIQFELDGLNGAIKWVGEPPVASPNDVTEGAVFIELPRDQLVGGKNKVKVNVISEGKIIDVAKTTFMSPIN